MIKVQQKISAQSEAKPARGFLYYSKLPLHQPGRTAVGAIDALDPASIQRRPVRADPRLLVADACLVHTIPRPAPPGSGIMSS